MMQTNILFACGLFLAVINIILLITIINVHQKMFFPTSFDESENNLQVPMPQHLQTQQEHHLQTQQDSDKHAKVCLTISCSHYNSAICCPKGETANCFCHGFKYPSCQCIK